MSNLQKQDVGGSAGAGISSFLSPKKRDESPQLPRSLPPNHASGPDLPHEP
jgi:hypothetical protein